MRSLYPTSLAAACALALVLALGCDRRVERSQPVTVRALMGHNPPSLSLIGKTDNNTEKIAAQITDSLVQFNPQMVLKPRVAESWEFSDDRLELTFRLRGGVRWHDGRPVTAEDVVFSVTQARDPAVENRTWAPLFQDLLAV